ncbi:MAG: tetratricopeptide repeat protein [Gemmatimonadales bacterium]|jgi:tetratricopeptide (TPR) repeat protein
MGRRLSALNAFVGDLKRRRVFRATAVYAVVAWVVVEVSATTFPYLLLPEWTVTLVIVLAILGFPITVGLAWAFDVTPRGVRRTTAMPAVGAAEQETTRGRVVPWRRLVPVVATSLAVLVGGGGLLLLLFHPASGEAFEARDWILIPEFENETGDESFDGTLAAALRTSVQQSTHVNVVDQRRVADALRQMGEEPQEKITREMALEVGARVGSKAVLLGRLRPEAQGYALSADIVDPSSGKPLRRTLSVVVSQRETVLVALDVLAKRIRRVLGEPVAEIEAGAVEIPVATTSSLQALKNWVEGGVAWREGRYQEAGKFFQLAVEQDSMFAMAHAALGGYYYYWENDRPRGDHHFSVALGLRNRLTERERLLIEARAHAFRGDHTQAITIRRVYLRKYPDDADLWYGLGTSLMRLRRCDEAVPAFRRALEIDAQFVSAFVNTATCQVLVGDFTSALETYGHAFDLRPELRTDLSLNHEYGQALMGVAELDAARSHFELMLPLDPLRKARGHRSLALLSAYQGQYRRAGTHFREAVQYCQAEGGGLSEFRNRLFLVTVYWAQRDTAALARELDAVWDLQSRHFIAPSWLGWSGQVFVWNDQLDRARRNLELIRERANEGNRVDAAAENLVQGEILLAVGDLGSAIEVLSLAWKQRADAVNLEALARAQRLRGDLEDAIGSYGRIVEQRILGWEGQERWLSAHYWLGRLHEEIGDDESAATWYRKLLDIWATGDEDLPLRQDMERRLAELDQD